MRVQAEPREVARLRMLRDGCEFRGVRACLGLPPNGRQGIVVNARYSLEEIVALLNGSDESTVPTHLATFLGEGVIKLLAIDLRSVRGAHRDHVILVDTIPDHRQADVILLEPIFYLQLHYEYLCEHHNCDRDELGYPLRLPEINCAACRRVGRFSSADIRAFEDSNDGW